MKRERRPRLLVIDDGETYAQAVADQMPEFFRVDPGKHGSKGRIGDGPAAIDYLARHAGEVDVVLLDVHFDVAVARLLPLDDAAPVAALADDPRAVRRLRRHQGIAILRALRRRWPALPVVLLTALEDLSLVDAAHDVSAGTMTWFSGPSDLDTLRIRIHGALQEAALALEEDGILWGRDPATRTLRRRLALLSRGTMPVILEGETGTGKSHLARHFIHRNSGRSGPFLSVDVTTVPAELVPALLFGSLRGSYTGATTDRKGAFEAAHQGTLFIDEVQNIPPEVQKQLLSVLQEGRVRPIGATRDLPVDVKVVVAANESLAHAVAAGRFRRDLYMRLSPASRIRLVPLRERLDDLPFFLRRMAAQALDRPDIAELAAIVATAVGLDAGAAIALVIGPGAGATAAADVLELALPTAAWKALAAHRWDGNMRELEMVVANLVGLTLFAAADAVRSGMQLSSTRLQIDAALIAELLGATAIDAADGDDATSPASADATVGERATDAPYAVDVEASHSLNSVMVGVERQVYAALFERTAGDFERMAVCLLGDGERSRAVRQRFNQLGLSARELRRDER